FISQSLFISLCLSLSQYLTIAVSICHSLSLSLSLFLSLSLSLSPSPVFSFFSTLQHGLGFSVRSALSLQALCHTQRTYQHSLSSLLPLRRRKIVLSEVRLGNSDIFAHAYFGKCISSMHEASSGQLLLSHGIYCIVIL
ncbi:MAG: hypothetical protein KTM48_03790, partial [Wolbachia endosymbiont of Pissodes strobi]|nr:hypothetical protein [Wolbachia endosymbiont of Pissodes strobi]